MGIYIRDMTLEEFSTYGEDCQSLICQGFVDEIPSHGRLIDADALLDSDGDIWDGMWGYSGVQIANAPTIITAEKGET